MANYGGYRGDEEKNPFQSPNEVEMKTYSPAYDQNQRINVLQECQDIQQAITQERARLMDLQNLHRSLIVDVGDSGFAAFNQASKAIMANCKALVQRARVLKSDPSANEARYTAQVQLTDRRVREFMNEYQLEDQRMFREIEDQQVRQYQIAVPAATDEQAREMVRQGEDNVFRQAIMSSDRHGQVQSALSAAQSRRQQMEALERQMDELAELVVQLDVLLDVQGETINAIDAKIEDAKEHTVQANQELVSAVKSGRSRNKKKVWCLVIIILILIVIGIIVGIVVAVNKGLIGKKNN